MRVAAAGLTLILAIEAGGQDAGTRVELLGPDGGVVTEQQFVDHLNSEYDRVLDGGVYPLHSAVGCRAQVRGEEILTCAPVGPSLSGGWWIEGEKLLQTGQELVRLRNENAQLNAAGSSFLWGAAAGAIVVFGYVCFFGPKVCYPNAEAAK